MRNTRLLESKCVDAIVSHYKSLGLAPDIFENDGIMNIDVSFDGTWQKRGHNSTVGVQFVIECLTGIVVDFDVQSTYCNCCTILEAKKKNISLEEYQRKCDICIYVILVFI